MPAQLFACCISGRDMYFEVMYCQSKEKLKSPWPSFEEIPPNIVISNRRVGGFAFMEARHGMLTPLNQGQMYDAIGSQKNITMDEIPKTRRRSLLAPLGSRWKV